MRKLAVTLRNNAFEVWMSKQIERDRTNSTRWATVWFRFIRNETIYSGRGFPTYRPRIEVSCSFGASNTSEPPWKNLYLSSQMTQQLAERMISTLFFKRRMKERELVMTPVLNSSVSVSQRLNFEPDFKVNEFSLGFNFVVLMSNWPCFEVIKSCDFVSALKVLWTKL